MDVLVIASPVYSWGLTGPMKIQLDRTFARCPAFCRDQGRSSAAHPSRGIANRIRRLYWFLTVGSEEEDISEILTFTLFHGREVKDAHEKAGNVRQMQAWHTSKKPSNLIWLHCKKNNRALSAIMNFITFQLLMLAHLQNRFQNMNFGKLLIRSLKKSDLADSPKSHVNSEMVES